MNSRKVTKELQTPCVSFNKEFDTLDLAEAATLEAGRYPKPLKLGPRTTVWRRSEIIKLIDELESESK